MRREEEYGQIHDDGRRPDFQWICACVHVGGRGMDGGREREGETERERCEKGIQRSELHLPLVVELQVPLPVPLYCNVLFKQSKYHLNN